MTSPIRRGGWPRVSGAGSRRCRSHCSRPCGDQAGPAVPWPASTSSRVQKNTSSMHEIAPVSVRWSPSRAAHARRTGQARVKVAGLLLPDHRVSLGHLEQRLELRTTAGQCRARTAARRRSVGRREPSAGRRRSVFRPSPSGSRRRWGGTSRRCARRARIEGRFGAGQTAQQDLGAAVAVGQDVGEVPAAEAGQAGFHLPGRAADDRQVPQVRCPASRPSRSTSSARRCGSAVDASAVAAATSCR